MSKTMGKNGFFHMKLTNHVLFGKHCEFVKKDNEKYGGIEKAKDLKKIKPRGDLNTNSKYTEESIGYIDKIYFHADVSLNQ